MHALPPSLPVAIAFRDPAHGALATGRAVEETDDGGRTWRVVLKTAGVSWVGFDASGRPVTVAPPPPASTPCRRPARVATSGAWLLCIGQGSAGSGEKAIYRRTADGWRRLAWATLAPTVTAHGIGLPGYALGISMAADGFGLIWEDRGTLFITRDGGSRWLGLPRVAVPEVDFGISGAALPHGVAFVLLARDGDLHRRLLETTDYGRTWRVVHRWG